MKVFLNSFYPLCYTLCGRTAIKKYALQPYIDGSCRREPDFLHSQPAITGICRLSKLINRLSVGDLVIYITNRAKYDRGFKHCKLVAILQVTNILSTHVEASEFYGDNLPNNIIVDGNNPYALEQTHLRNKKGYSLTDGTPNVRKWDLIYKNRVKTESRVAITKPWFNNIKVQTPITITDEKMISIFGRKPCCQNPPMLTLDEWERFQCFIGHLNS